MIPSSHIEKILFNGPIDSSQLPDPFNNKVFLNQGGFNEINWLNTPGPIYTTHTDNCGTGQIEAINNVGGNEDYHEIVFKQPFTWQELTETLTAAAVDPFNAYFFDGNENWTTELIIIWWSESKKRIDYILKLYHEELILPAVLDRLLYGPQKPIPINYKNWLDFYQNGMKEYLEWYMLKLGGKPIILTDLDFNWTEKNELDSLLGSGKTPNGSN